MATPTPNPTPAAPRGRLIPASRWNDYHEWPPPGGMRHLIFNAAKNGFEHAVRRCGRRVLIDETAFFEYVEKQNGAPGHE